MSVWLYHPIDEWQHELEKASKSGLLECIDNLMMFRGFTRESLMKMAKHARRAGRYHDAMAASARYQANPNAELARYMKRSKASKKAARAAKRAKKGTR